MSKLSIEVYLTTKPGFRGPFLGGFTQLYSSQGPSHSVNYHRSPTVKFTQPTAKCCLLKDETVFFFHERIL